MEYYHVITQSYGGKNIFPTEADCLVYLQLVKGACQKYDVQWLAYAVMPTHTHLVVAVANGNVTHLKHMRYKVACGYAAYFRKVHPEICRGEKHIFHRKNQVKILQTPYDVKQEIRYAHLNPLRKNLETLPGQTIRSSYSAVLSFWEKDAPENPFNRFIELQEIRDALALEEVSRFFGRNRNEQKASFLSFHQAPLQEDLPLEKVTPDKLVKAEELLRTYFAETYVFQGKDYNVGNRQAFLYWLNRRGNKRRTALVLQLRRQTAMRTHEIAIFLNTSDSTIKRILQKYL